MRVFTLKTSKMQTNTYVVVNGDRAFAVDAGGDAEGIKKILDDNGARLEAILLTHAHFDHIGGVAELLTLTKSNDENAVAVFLHRDEADKISSYKNLGFAVGVKVEPFVPDVLLRGGESITVAGIKIKVIHTAGHTAGGVCYVADDKIFSGDTLFLTSYGRTDFYDGSFAEIKNSIVNKLFRLKGDYTVLPGHGDPTTLDFERKNNMVLLS
ncbi:MAG: MBL fold metallo-hydrolase [Bacteroides sp.]|nr:MBL fold metallo-hydrolase [Bacillota bacterium]MCM1394060.1 MBL fold metallo-hydrolase [[Eubacterium] siraeum]MCM1455579.1 MBL fold metallo-hydrolase [Bacteroides sp.]